MPTCPLIKCSLPNAHQEIDVVVYEGERAHVDANNKLGSFVISGVQRARAGEHKVVALWKYDKRDYHGSPVVYHGMRLHNVEADEPLLRGMVAYVTAVLDALGITDGAMHSEIMATARGPVLVEVHPPAASRRISAYLGPSRRISVHLDVCRPRLR